MNQKRVFTDQQTSAHPNSIIANGYMAQQFIQQALAQYARDTARDNVHGKPVVIIVEILEQE